MIAALKFLRPRDPELRFPVGRGFQRTESSLKSQDSIRVTSHFAIGLRSHTDSCYEVGRSQSPTFKLSLWYAPCQSTAVYSHRYWLCSL